ncbi:MAG: carbohydrate ABC transporter permease [Firmicutes bacterium]|nr:carbohydrate ABC transporter permease [Bacillota bacterium]
MGMTKHGRIKRILLGLAIILMVVIWAGPILVVMISSFKPAGIIRQESLVLIFRPSVEHYRFIFTNWPFWQFLINSVIVSCVSTAIAVTVGSLAAYSMARFNTGGPRYSFWILSTRMAPPAVLVIPFFMMFSRLRLVNTWWVLIFVYLTFNLSFVIWTMRSFFEEIPEAIEEAAMIDGCTRLLAFRHVVLPLVSPGLAATMMFTLIFSWNEFIFALVLSAFRKTLPLALGDFVTGYAINWGPLFAAGTFVMVPAIIFTLIMQRRLIRGLTLGAVV